MERPVFIFILYFIQVIRWLLVGIIGIPMALFSAKFLGRLKFEVKNFDDSPSFKVEGRIAHVAFEVSSEGEYEQIKPLLDLYLKRGDLVELIYSSDSLDSKLKSLQSENANLRTLRLPVLAFSPFQNKLLDFQNISYWLTAPTLILCRYDFYPELLLYGLRKDKRFCLLSATFKNKKNNWWSRQVYKSFDSILATSDEDKTRIEGLGVDKQKVRTYEFRVLQIFERLENSGSKLGPYNPLVQFIKSFDRNNRIILGSAWPIEMDIFESEKLREDIKNGNKLLMVLPHLFNNDIRNKLASFDLPVYSYKDGENLDTFIDTAKAQPGVIILEVKGILLELYELFGHAFVGGGHGRSVHSLMEPFLAGCHVYCGPKTHRSTEYDFIKSSSSEDISVIDNLGEFYEIHSMIKESDLVLERKKMRESYRACFNQQVDFIGGLS